MVGRLEPFPPVLEPFRAKLGRAVKPFVKLSRHPDQTIGLSHSKLGGFPYLPYSLEYPINADGVPLLFIAQINFAEVPPLPNYPQQGILQFFLSSIGAQTCTVRYLPAPDPNANELVGEADLKLLMEMNAPGRLLDNPITRPGRLQFELDEAPPHPTSVEFEQLFGNDLAGTDNGCLDQTYQQWIEPSRCHKLGGYGHFVQGDPRSHPEFDPGFAEFDLLLELNSDEANFGLRWGDCQEICFFVRPQDLQQQNFSRIRYYLCP